MSGDEVLLSVEVPRVVEEPCVTVVRCGETTVEVKDHGSARDGAWAAWSHGRIVGGGWLGYPYEEALGDAYKAAEHQERRRLLRASLDDVLATWDSDDDESGLDGTS